jgi:hypothetical protein
MLVLPSEVAVTMCYLMSNLGHQEEALEAIEQSSFVINWLQIDQQHSMLILQALSTIS